MESTIVREADGAVVCARCTIAATPLRRMRGLLGHASLPSGEGMLLRPAPSVHTFFMRFPIDIVFLDRDDAVVGIKHRVVPWRLAFGHRARATLELAAGEAERLGLQVGDVLTGS